MPGYRPLTADQRADHIETLVMLGRLLVAQPTSHSVLRAFVVMTVQGACLQRLTAELRA